MKSFSIGCFFFGSFCFNSSSINWLSNSTSIRATNETALNKRLHIYISSVRNNNSNPKKEQSNTVEWTATHKDKWKRRNHIVVAVVVVIVVVEINIFRLKTESNIKLGRSLNILFILYLYICIVLSYFGRNCIKISNVWDLKPHYWFILFSTTFK